MTAVQDQRALARVLTVAWMAVALGVVIQLLVLAFKFALNATVPAAQFLADLAQSINWSLIVCAAVGLGTLATKARGAVMGVLGLISGPIGWGVAKGTQRGVQGLLGVPVDQINSFFYLVCLLKGIEYCILGAALGFIGARGRPSARAHVLCGIAVGAAAAALFVGLNYWRGQAIGAPLPSIRLVALSVNEFFFPIGCALVIFFAQRVKGHIRIMDESTKGSGSAPQAETDQSRPASAPIKSAQQPFSGHGTHGHTHDVRAEYGPDSKPPQDPRDLLQANKEWARKRIAADKGFFSRLSKVQKPQFLWIGCSDSRVPANEIVGLDPGEMFVHRNIANVVPHTDLNCLSVIQYAVEQLGVRHIIVTGHYGCGGVKAAMRQKDFGQIDNWLAQIKDVYSRHYDEICELDDEHLRLDRLCELNVTTQVRHVAKTSIVQHAWRAGKSLSIHGWIYSLEDGILRDLGKTITGIEDLHKPYRILG